MDFGFSDEQRDVRELARRILSQQVSPERLAAFDEYAAPRFDRDLWRMLHEAGLPSVAVEERYGGMGMGLQELLLVVEEAGRQVAPLPLVHHCVGGMLALQRFASSTQCERWLAPAANGGTLLAAALPPATGGLSARPEGEDLVLDGSLEAVAFGAQADAVVLAARLQNDHAIVLLDTRAPGLLREERQTTSFEPQARLVLDGVRVPASDVLRHTGGGEVIEWLRERLSVALCAHQLGVAEAAMRMAASYTSEREQFGVPIATFQAVGHRLANCYIDIECLRLATYQAGSLLHDELPATLETRIAKVWAGDAGHRVSYATQHVHGGTGIDRDYPLWRFCLWLRHNEMTLGSSSEQLAAIGESLAEGGGLFA